MKVDPAVVASDPLLSALPESSWSPSLSPDGARVAYVSDRDGAPRVWVQDLDGRRRRARALELGPHPVERVRWSVDGEWLAAMLAPGGSPRTQVWAMRPGGEELRPIAAESEGAAYLGPWSHCPGIVGISEAFHAGGGVAALVDVRTGDRREVAREGHPMLLDIDRHDHWALIRRGPRGQRTMWAVDTRTGDEQHLAPDPGTGSTDLGHLSPDGRLAYVRSDVGREYHALFAIALRPPGERRTTLLAERSDADLEHFALTAGGEAAVLLWSCAGRSLCERLDLRTGARSELPLPAPVAHDLGFSRDGRRLAVTLEGPAQPRAIWVLDLSDGRWRLVTPLREGPIAPVALPSLERVRSSDGLEFTGWLYRARARGARGDAAVIYLHGGPEAQERPGYSDLFQRLVARGISVFASNVRGSSGFGRTFVTADDLAGRFGAIRDVAACVHHLVMTGVADPSRIACAGRSYGGYLTLAALVFHPDLFAAGVDICGMADFHTFYAHTEPWIAAAAYPEYGHPERDADLLRALSPIHRFDALRAPLLVVHGENDTNVPVEEAEQVVAAARSRNIPVEFMRFDGEGHELMGRRNRLAFLERTVNWLAERLA